MISRRFKLAVAFGGLVGAALAFAFPPIVKYQAAKAAGRYGAVLAIGGIAPTLGGVRLVGVDVTLDEVPSVRIHLDEVEVAYGARGRKVSFHGGAVAAVGARDVVLREAEAWRSKHAAPEGGTAGQGSSRGEVELDGLKLSWADAVTNPSETLSATDLRLARTDGQLAVSTAEATLAVGRTSFSMKGGRVELVRGEGGYRVGALSATGVDAVVVVPAPKAAPPDGPTLNLDRPPPLPDPGPKRAGRAGATRVARSSAPPPSREPAPSAVDPAPGPGAAYRGMLLGAAQALDRALDPNARIRLDGVRALLRRGDDALNLGPGALHIGRSDGKLVIELAPELRPVAPPASPAPPAAPDAGAPAGHEETLTFRLALPLADPAGEIAVDVDGGPIWLSSLGIHDGDFGLFDVNLASLSTRSHLVLPADGRTLRVDGEAKVHALSLKNTALSDEPVAGLELAMRLKGEIDLDGSRARIAEAEVDLGAIRLIVQGDYDRTADGHRFRGSFDVPITACQSMLDSTPKGLVPKLQGMRLAGSFALRGRADCDTAHLDRFLLDWDTANSCRVVEAPPGISVDRFRTPFRRTAYDPEGRPVSIETGPGTPEWVPLTAISKFMETAVLTTEDGAFHRHHGFDHEAIRNSIRENLRQKRFVRGASTISMQLSKNLYLDRGKNLSRKLQEAVLTMYLEQELTKEQILELYLNVVEFGPMVYGIGPAARHYFSTGARDLSLGQALYISSIMPNPKIQHFGAGGAVSPTWMNYLHKLMQLARDRGNLTDEELDEGLRETVVRGSPTPQRSAKPADSGPINGSEPEMPPEGADAWP